MCGGKRPTYTDPGSAILDTEDAAAIATREARLRAKQAAAYGRPSTMLTPTGRTSMLGAALLPASTPKAPNFGGVR